MSKKYWYEVSGGWRDVLTVCDSREDALHLAQETNNIVTCYVYETENTLVKVWRMDFTTPVPACECEHESHGESHKGHSKYLCTVFGPPLSQDEMYICTACIEVHA